MIGFNSPKGSERIQGFVPASQAMVVTELLGLFVGFGHGLRVTRIRLQGSEVECLAELAPVV